MIPVIHRGCGGQVGWFLRDTIEECEIMKAADFMRMDGTHPVDGGRLREECPRCGKVLGQVNELERVI
jgi:ribosomal protein S27AE